MRELGTSSGAAALVVALLAILPAGADLALSDPSGTDVSLSAAPPVPPCGSNELMVYRSNLSPGNESGREATQRRAAEVAEARAYVIETASPGYTMTLQGPELAIGRLHPEFVVRLAHAIRETRNAGLPFAGVFSAYRPPAFGVGGFSDKFNSLHTYGLAVDMRGIGSPGSPEAQLWHEIAAKNGVVCPYGPSNPVEWNHCQPTSVKMILAENPLSNSAILVQKLLLGDNPPIWMSLGYSLALVAVVFLPIVMVWAMFAIWWERKVAGHIQSRLGPNRVGPFGLLQSLADGIKLLTKEDLLPKDADRVLFRLAAYLAFAPVWAWA